MKRLAHIFLLFGLLAAFSPVFLVPGCATGSGETSKPTPQAVAYFTLRDTWDAVDGAMRVYGLAVVEGKVSAATEKKIDSAHAKFRLAFKSAVRLASHDYTAATPDNVGALAAEVLTLVQEFR